VSHVADREALHERPRSQASRLPAEFRFSGREVFIERQRDALIIRPRPVGWDDLFARPSQVPAYLLAEREDPEPERLGLL